MSAHFAIQAAHCTRIHLEQAGCAFQRAAFGQMFANRHGFGFSHFRVPQGGLLAFTELAAADATTLVANLVGTVVLSHRQIVLTGLPVQFAAPVDTC